MGTLLGGREAGGKRINAVRSQPVLVTGSSGYVGGQPVPQLLSSGHRVRVLGRSLAKLLARPWATHPFLEMVQADVMDLESLKKACRGCWAAFYLVHSMSAPHKDFAAADRKAAVNMAKAASEEGVERIIYLGRLGEESDSLSKHLKSRMEVARILQSGSVPTTFLRAAMILGSGSASFEILRYLVAPSRHDHSEMAKKPCAAHLHSQCAELSPWVPGECRNHRRDI